MKKTFFVIAVISILVPAALVGSEKFDYLTELKNGFQTAYGEEAKNDALKGKTVLLYFTASWCPPCRAFTPKLVKFAGTHKDDVVVVVISRDRTKEAALKYMKKNKAEVFYMIPPGKESNSLSQKFGIRGIPSIVAISKEGKVLSKNARGQIAGSDELPEDWKTSKKRVERKVERKIEF